MEPVVKPVAADALIANVVEVGAGVDRTTYATFGDPYKITSPAAYPCADDVVIVTTPGVDAVAVVVIAADWIVAGTLAAAAVSGY